MNRVFIHDELPDVFIVCYVLFAIFWDSPETNLIHKAIKSRFAPIVRILGLGHAWSMYTGPFTRIARLQTRVGYSDNTTEILQPLNRYEFRRYYFMIGVHPSQSLYNQYLKMTEKRLRDSGRQIETIEIVRQVWKSPVRVGGLLGRFELPSEASCVETVVARWKSK